MKKWTHGMVGLLVMGSLAWGQAPQRPGELSSRSYRAGSPFSVITVGTGSPRYDASRSAPANLIQHRGQFYLVDMGNGTQAKLHEMGLSARMLSALILTHHHLDHNEELIPLFMNSRLMGAKPPVMGPPGTRRYIDFLLSAYAEDLDYRLARKGQSKDDLQPIEIRELQGGESFMLGAMKVTTAKVNHSIHTIAYRFDADGQSIVISGDLSYSDSLIQLAKGADVLVMDSGGLVQRVGVAARPSRLARPGGAASRPGAAHASAEDVAGMAAKAGVKHLVLTHITPGEVDEAATLAVARKIYQGKVTIARDMLEVPAKATSAATGTTAAAAASRPPSRIFVGAGTAAATPDGRTWASAYPEISAALDAAEKSGAREVWVAAGTYYPTRGTDRSQSIRLRKGVSLLGGFAGNETDSAQRQWDKHATILSGDIGQPGIATDNSFTVVTGADEAVLDGFTITSGNGMNAGPPGGGGPPGGMPRGSGSAGGPIHTSPEAVLSGPPRGAGGGMVNYQCAPKVRHCIFRENQAAKGGAVYNMTAHRFPPGMDGDSQAIPVFEHCRFISNRSRARGGAVANDLGTAPAFRDCEFTANVCDGKGGAIYNDFSCSPLLANCLFTRNQANAGGAMANDGGSSPWIVHCTITANRATQEGAGLYQGTGPSNSPTLTACIVWGNQCDDGPADLFNWHDNAPVIRQSCIGGGWPGEGNVDCDPQFSHPSAGDFSLKPGSPCAGMGYTVATSADLLVVPRRVLSRPAPPQSRPAIADGPKVVWRVDARVRAGPQDGRSWATAFASLDAAMQAAAGQPCEIWVAAGTYRPTRSGGRQAIFELGYGMEIYGGFRGFEHERKQRDWKLGPTILCGDIGRPGDPADNCYHVVRGEDHAVLDGFVVRNGNANGSGYDAKGGGMINYRRGPQVGPMGAASGFSPCVRNCVFEDNHAIEGGAIYNYDRSKPEFDDCHFRRNRADYGAAMVDRVGVRSRLTKSRFEGNHARWRGGAIYLDYGARPVFKDCYFVRNRSACHGGAVALVSRASQLENTIALFEGCQFLENVAAKRGGAMSATDSSVAGLKACDIVGNQAGSGGGAIAMSSRSRVVLVNATMSANRSRSGDAGVAQDPSSVLSTQSSDWPSQASAPGNPARGHPGGPGDGNSGPPIRY